jgi:hypothetical protein
LEIHQVPYAAHKRDPDCCPTTAIARSLPRVEGDSGRGGRCGVGSSGGGETLSRGNS